MKQLTDSPIIETLERLGAAFPWEGVALWVKREAQGKCNFTAVAEGLKELGFEWQCCAGDTPEEAATSLINAYAAGRDPEIQRQKAIRTLEEQLEKLRRAVLGLPPYRPGCYLTEGNTNTPAGETIDVSSKAEQVPF